MKKLKEIRQHLANLHEAWEKDGGGYHKSNEGYVEVVWTLPDWFEFENKEEYINAEPELSGVGVYSYLFGPGRLHKFDSIDEAHKEVLSWEYEKEEF
jgi:hypothetical protein